MKYENKERVQLILSDIEDSEAMIKAFKRDMLLWPKDKNYLTNRIAGEETLISTLKAELNEL